MKSEGMKFILMQQYHQLSKAEHNKVFNSWWRFHQILMKFDAKFHQILQRSNFAKFWWCKMLLFAFSLFWFLQVMESGDFIFQQRSVCWVFFNLDSVAVWGGGLERQPEILDAHEATLAVLIPDLKQDLKTSSNRWHEELHTDYRQ
jgi:hypothetical protein